MTGNEESVEKRIDRLHASGLVDFHFDLLIDLYEKRDRPGVVVSHFLPEFEAGSIRVLGVAVYIEDRYLPETGLRVALDQVARLYAEVEQTERLAILPISIQRGLRTLSILRANRLLFHIPTCESFMTSSATSATSKSRSSANAVVLSV